MQTHNPGRIWKRKGDGGTDYYGVLRGAAAVGTPGILMEHSFHTNRRATEWLMQEANLRKLAQAEAQTIAEYFGVTKPAEPETGIANEPLMKIGNYADTVSFAQAGVTIPTASGANILDMTSTIKPSEVSITGNIKSN